ncbi:unnamed protein product [Caenorhabditis auriculariae]|uniref:NEDD8-activating enzyme E1 catalytic subunit n=1 Tax=Caenorhabditis auriculariae TaxID=2777116 RepID=A0A8S1GRB3_9PELO|nr:unnamed protein product [Caenorhabditis auriculariae]
MVSVDPLASERWRHIRRLTDRPTAFAPAWFEPGPHNFNFLRNSSVLVIGAGGLGCELLKNLALSGIKNISVIDMDTIDLSNLNRQFLFREIDVGKSKAEVAAAFIEKRVSGCSVTPYNCRIEDKPAEFYRRFTLVICGLDSIAARRWINAMLCDLVQTLPNGEIDQTTIVPMIDGGTEGFKGNARVIYPRMSACVDCTLDLFPPQVNFPLCTIAHTPRLPEHCIEYIKVVVWPKERPFEGESLDADNPAHVEWVLERSMARAEEFGIRGVNRRLTSGVLKRIIPAVASTNAVVAASCALEAFKLLTNTASVIDNYMNFTQIEGVYSGVVHMEKDPNCATCSGGSFLINVSPDDVLEQFMERIVAKFQLRNPYLETLRQKLFWVSDFYPEMIERNKANLGKPLRELVNEGEEILVVADNLSKPISVRVSFS